MTSIALTLNCTALLHIGVWPISLCSFCSLFSTYKSLLRLSQCLLLAGFHINSYSKVHLCAIVFHREVVKFLRPLNVSITNIYRYGCGWNDSTPRLLGIHRIQSYSHILTNYLPIFPFVQFYFRCQRSPKPQSSTCTSHHVLNAVLNKILRYAYNTRRRKR